MNEVNLSFRLIKKNLLLKKVLLIFFKLFKSLRLKGTLLPGMTYKMGKVKQNSKNKSGVVHLTVCVEEEQRHNNKHISNPWARTPPSVKVRYCFSLPAFFYLFFLMSEISNA